MATNAYYLNQFISTTLSTAGGIDDSQTTGIKITSTSGVTTDKPGILCLSYSDPIDTTKAEWISYTSIDVFNELQGVTRGEDGFSAKKHSNGVTVAFPISRSHINNLNDALIIGGDETNLLEGVLDEDDMASDSATKGATQQSIKAYVDNNPYGGWLTAGLSGVTITRQSTDNPTVVLRFNADVTDHIWKGSRLKATENSIVHYFIVSADPVFSSPNTDVTCLSEIDTATPTQAKALIGSTTISDVAYAPPKTYPKGFPINVFSWSLINAKNDSTTISSPTSSAWYNDPNFNLIIPIGDFDLFHTWDIFTRPASAQNINFTSTVGTVNNNSGYREMTHSHRWTTQDGGSGNDSSFTFTTNHYVSMAVKTTLYTNLRVIGSPSDMRMLSGVHRATSTLL